MLIIHSLNLRYIFLARSEILAIFKGRYVFDKVRGGGGTKTRKIYQLLCRAMLCFGEEEGDLLFNFNYF